MAANTGGVAQVVQVLPGKQEARVQSSVPLKEEAATKWRERRKKENNLTENTQKVFAFFSPIHSTGQHQEESPRSWNPPQEKKERSMSDQPPTQWGHCLKGYVFHHIRISEETGIEKSHFWAKEEGKYFNRTRHAKEHHRTIKV